MDPEAVAVKPQYATREQAVRPSKRRYVDVYVPEEDCWYRIRNLTEDERGDYEDAISDGSGDADPRIVRAELMVRVCVDEKGDLLFGPDDVLKLSRKDSSVTGRIYSAAVAHCGYETGSPEDLRKNSLRRPAADSP